MTRIAAVSVFAAFIFSAVLVAIAIPDGAGPEGGSRPDSDAKAASSPRKPAAVGHPTFVSPHASPIAIRGGLVFVVNTPSDTVDVIDAKTRKILARVNVGIDPVGIAVRPDGKEVWVSNHVSDSVSVIDSDPKSPAYLQVIATIQAAVGSGAGARAHPRATARTSPCAPDEAPSGYGRTSHERRG